MTEDTTGVRTDDADTVVEIVGEVVTSMTHTAVEELPHVERDCTVTCASGDRTTATWTGVDVLAVLDRAEASPDTTHIVVESDDGYRACVSLSEARSALLALARDGQPLDRTEPYTTRFVGTDVDGERSVKGVVRIEAVTLGSTDDPADLETLSLDDPAYG